MARFPNHAGSCQTYATNVVLALVDLDFDIGLCGQHYRVTMRLKFGRNLGDHSAAIRSLLFGLLGKESSRAPLWKLGVNTLAVIHGSSRTQAPTDGVPEGRRFT
jgi:hypothetical protein